MSLVKKVFSTEGSSVTQICKFKDGVGYSVYVKLIVKGSSGACGMYSGEFVIDVTGVREFTAAYAKSDAFKKEHLIVTGEGVAVVSDVSGKLDWIVEYELFSI
jgi:hypothetical protein